MSDPTVLIADDQDLVRSGLELFIAARGCEVVGTASDGWEAVQLTRELRPDVVLVDIRMPVMDGIAATRIIVGESLPTKVLGVDDLRPGQPRLRSPGRRGRRLPSSRRPRRTAWSRGSALSRMARHSWPPASPGG